MEYEMVAGFEVHCQLKTISKMFCNCENIFGASQNARVCPICSGMPGILPVINKEALKYAIKVALALNCTIAEFTKFDRKNYYYPDLPKNYQISQYDLPLSSNGYVEIDMDGRRKRIGIIRVHLEEDAGKLVHPEIVDDLNGAGDEVEYLEKRGIKTGERADFSLVDFNRSGVPLLEIVSKPDINTPQEAYVYLTTLKSILQYLEVSDCDMEKGSLRCDVNMSVRKKGETKLGVKTEIKNLNSFKFIVKALEYETKRQIEILDSGGRIFQETRLFNQIKGITEPMRSKEEAKDYRYFPEPDLVPMVFDKDLIESIRNSLPELAISKKKRFVEQYKLPDYDAEVLTSDKYLADYFEETVKHCNDSKTASNWIMSEIMRFLNENKIDIKQFPIKPKKLAELINLINSKIITTAIGRDVFQECITSELSPKKIVEMRQMTQISDEAQLKQIAEKIIRENEKVVGDYKQGKKNAIGVLIGKAMRETQGKANAELLKNIFLQMLGK